MSLLNGGASVFDAPAGAQTTSLLNGKAPLAAPPTQADAWDANSKAYGDWVAKERADGIAKGLIDPQTGWPTKAGLEDAARQLAQSVMMGTTAPGARGLPMDAASRMARAEKMGFDTNTVWYHGTSGDHETLSPAYTGSVTSHGDPGTWFTQSVPYASEYAQNAAGMSGGEPRIIDAHIRSDNPLVVHFPDGPKNPVVNGEVMDFHDNADIMKYAQKNGHDVVYMPDGNFTEESAAVSVFNPTNIRSTDAAFDPKMDWSDNINH